MLSFIQFTRKQRQAYTFIKRKAVDEDFPILLEQDKERKEDSPQFRQFFLLIKEQISLLNIECFPANVDL